MRTFALIVSAHPTAHATSCIERELSNAMKVVQKRTVVGDLRLDNLSRSNLQCPVNGVCQWMVIMIIVKKKVRLTWSDSHRLTEIVFAVISTLNFVQNFTPEKQF